MLILGIESSCDETAAAVYDTERRAMLSSKLFSQTELHKHYGGVVPEIASRAQLEKITYIVKEALTSAQVALADIDTIAVTNRPGLPGSLLVGVCFAKAYVYTQKKRIIGIDHLEGHAFSAMIENSIPFPYLCMTASGGHTSLYRMNGLGDYTLLGTTMDDAAGEAFDKVAKMMNYPYPGGPAIEKLAGEVGFKDFFHYPRLKEKSLNFSFSGIKTAVLYDLVKKGAYNLNSKQFLAADDIRLQQEVASSLLVAISDIFADRINRALTQQPDIRALAFVGGVACNQFIRAKLKALAEKQNIEFFVPSPQYCTDNAAMIAFVGAYKAEQGKFDDLTLDI